jgi:hypothetical protein
VRLEASTKPPIKNFIHEFLINMAFTMACPNFKKGLKMAFGPLGVKKNINESKSIVEMHPASYILSECAFHHATNSLQKLLKILP